MRKFHILMAAAALLLLASCSKTLKVDPVSFDVTTALNKYNVDSSVNFIFKGQPDMITFYSGEPGHNYEYRDRTIAKGKPQMQFTSLSQYGTQQNTLQLFISKDFDGTYDAADIAKATWTDITDKATLSTGGPNVPSGVIDLSSYTEAGKTFYFAFKYTGSSASTQKTWTIKEFQINLLLDDGSETSVADMVSAGWNAVSIKNDGRVWSVSASQLRIAGGGGGTPDNEDWLITSPLNPNKVSPDRGVAIKNITNNLPDYSYVYVAPGSYNPVFVGVNATRDGEKSAVKQLKITVAP
jgi:hypothetical protein